MPDELPCGYTHVSAFREQFLRKKSLREAVLPSGGVYHHLNRFLGRDLWFSRSFLSPSTYMNLRIVSDNFWEPFEILTLGGPTGLLGT